MPPLGHRETLAGPKPRPDVAAADATAAAQTRPIPLVVDAACSACAEPLIGGGGAFGTRLWLEPRFFPSAVPALSAFVSVAEIAAAAAPEAEGAASNRDASGGGASDAQDDEDAAAEDAGAAADGGSAAAEGPSFLVRRRALLALLLGELLLTHRLTRCQVDAMLGKLLRWLRVLGVDSLLRGEGEGPAELLSRARDERRILLTRDRRCGSRP